MRISRVIAGIVTAALIAFEASCSAGRSSIPVPQVASPLTKVRHARPDGSTTLVYACIFNADKCIWYQRGVDAIAGEIDGLQGPTGMAVDTSGDVYIANWFGGNVDVYGPGSGIRQRQLSDAGGVPIDVAVDADGTVYIANYSLSGQASGDVAVFAPGSSTVTRVITDPHFGNPNAVAIDEHRELVVCYNQGHDVFCDEFVHARGHGVTVATVLGGGGAGGAAFDNLGDLAVQPIVGGAAYFTPAFAQCGGDPKFGVETYIKFDRRSGDVFKSSHRGFIEERKYSPCAGGTLEMRYRAGLDAGNDLPSGIAIDPAPRR